MDKDNQAMVSIIIPVYNAEKYLERCINSVLAQTYKSFELIIIDDGSTDQSAKICERLAVNDSRIKIVSKINQGVSIARNTGIDLSKGKYLLFVDADDYIVDDMIQKMVTAIENTQSDMALCGFEVLGSTLRGNDTSTLKKCCGANKFIGVNSIELIKRTVSTNPNEILYGYIWRNLYRSDIIKSNSIHFAEKIKISEDFLFILEVAKYSDKVVLLPEDLYIYNINEGSVTAKHIGSMHYDMNLINEWVGKNICEDNPDIVDGYYCCVANTYLSFVQNICRIGTPFSLKERFIQVYKIKSEYKYKEVVKRVWKSKNAFRRKAWIAMILFRFNLDWLYVLLFSYKEKTIH